MDPINWKFYKTNHLILYMTLHLHERNFIYLFYKIYCIEHNCNQYINTHNSKACKYLCLCDIFHRFCPYTTPTSTATLSSAHQISENSDQQQPPPQPASCCGGCGCWSPYTGNLVEVAVGNCGCG